MNSFDSLQAMRAAQTIANDPYRDESTVKGAMARFENINNDTVDWFIKEWMQHKVPMTQIIEAYADAIGAQMAMIIKSMASTIDHSPRGGPPAPFGLTNEQACTALVTGQVGKSLREALQRDAEFKTDGPSILRDLDKKG